MSDYNFYKRLFFSLMVVELMTISLVVYVMSKTIVKVDNETCSLLVSGYQGSRDALHHKAEDVTKCQPLKDTNEKSVYACLSDKDDFVMVCTEYDDGCIFVEINE